MSDALTGPARFGRIVSFYPMNFAETMYSAFLHLVRRSLIPSVTALQR